MPANPKYLVNSNSQKFIKLFTAIVGGYIISALFHFILIILLQPYHKEILTTTTYTFYTVWVVLMLVSYLFKNAWKFYLIAIVVLAVIYFLIKHNNPFL